MGLLRLRLAMTIFWNNLFIKEKALRHQSLLLIFLALLTVAFPAVCEESCGRAAIFLSMPVGWKQIAMGGCGVAVGGDAISGWYNPASLQLYEGWGGSSGYSRLALDRWITYASAAGNLRDDAAVAVSWVHADAGHIPGRDISGYYTEDLAYGEDAIFLTFSKVVTSELSVGGNIKYLQAKLSDISTYVAGFDLGIHANFLRKQVLVGAIYRNLSLQYRWDSANMYGSEDGTTSNEKIPGSFKAGVACAPRGCPLMATFEMEYPSGSKPCLRMGISGSPVEGVDLAVGYDDGLPTAGASYEYDAGFAKFGLGYAFRFEREGLPPRHSFDLIVGTK